MAFVTDIQTASRSPLARIAGLINTVAARYTEYRAFQQTFKELSALDDRELADLGLHRSALRGIAKNAAQNA